MRPLWLCTLLAASLAGCAGFPALGPAAGPTAPALPYPAILPLDELLAQAAATGPSPAAALAARAAALQARAEALRSGP